MSNLTKVLDQYGIGIPDNGRAKGISLKVIRTNNQIVKLVDTQNQHLEEMKSLRENIKSKCSKELEKIKILKQNLKNLEEELLLTLGERRAYMREEKKSVGKPEVRAKYLIEKE